MERHTLSMLVKNSPGVLSRVSGLFSRRGYNIDSLSVGVTEDERLSRMTIVVNGDQYIVAQITKQLDKLIDIVKITELDPITSVCRGLTLVKVSADEKTRSEILHFINIFRANVIDISPSTMTIEITGDLSKQEALLELLQPFGVQEISKTGLAALQRGVMVLKEHDM